jgi:hypothetical protein
MTVQIAPGSRGMTNRTAARPRQPLLQPASQRTIQGGIGHACRGRTPIY